MTDKKNKSISSEVESRLKGLFMEENAADGKNPRETTGQTNSELRELKAFVLSIDWEINDEIMTGMMEQIKKLGPLYKNDRILMMFLQLLGSIGKYIKTKKSNAHPKSIKLLNSVYYSLEKAAHSPNLSDDDRKQLLQEEINSFQELKKEIALKKGVSVSEKMGKTAIEEDAVESQESREPDGEKKMEPAKPATIDMPPELAAAIEEIKKTIRREIQSLKEELRLWTDSK